MIVISYGVNLVPVTKDFPLGGFCSNQILDYLFISFPVGRGLMTEAEARSPDGAEAKTATLSAFPPPSVDASWGPKVFYGA